MQNKLKRVRLYEEYFGINPSDPLSSLNDKGKENNYTVTYTDNTKKNEENVSIVLINALPVVIILVGGLYMKNNKRAHRIFE